MSKWIFAVCGLVLCVAAVGIANDHYEVYNRGSGALYGGVGDGSEGYVPSGMRFGDQGHVAGGGETIAGCQDCFGVAPPMCDSCWRGPCVDWKLIGWYSNWSDKHRGCPGKRCCASRGGSCENDSGGACVSNGVNNGNCQTCN